MKILITGIFLFQIFMGFSQTPISYEDVVSLNDSVSKESLYNRGYHWVINIFKNPQKVVQLNDKESGQIVCKAAFKYDQTKWLWGGSEVSKGYVNYTVKLYFKNGRYKYVISDFIHVSESGDSRFGLITDQKKCPDIKLFGARGWKDKIWIDIKNQIETEANLLKNSLLLEMKNVNELEEDW